MWPIDGSGRNERSRSTPSRLVKLYGETKMRFQGWTKFLLAEAMYGYWNINGRLADAWL